MTPQEKQNKIDALNTNRNTSDELLAEIYTDLLTYLEPFLEQGEEIVNTLNNNEFGVAELRQIIQITKGNFLKKANQVITQNTPEPEIDPTP